MQNGDYFRSRRLCERWMALEDSVVAWGFVSRSRYSSNRRWCPRALRFRGRRFLRLKA